MSSDELVEAYAGGSISRRTFIRRLVATGVSLGAAVSYAHLLAPEADAGKHPRDFYVHFTPARVKVKDVLEAGKIPIMVTSARKATARIWVRLEEKGGRLLGKHKVRLRGSRKGTYKGSVTQWVMVPLSGEGRKALKGREAKAGSVSIQVTGIAATPHGRKSTSSDSSDLL